MTTSDLALSPFPAATSLTAYTSVHPSIHSSSRCRQSVSVLLLLLPSFVVLLKGAGAGAHARRHHACVALADHGGESSSSAPATRAAVRVRVRRRPRLGQCGGEEDGRRVRAQGGRFLRQRHQLGRHHHLRRPPGFQRCVSVRLPSDPLSLSLPKNPSMASVVVLCAVRVRLVVHRESPASLLCASPTSFAGNLADVVLGYDTIGGYVVSS